MTDTRVLEEMAERVRRLGRKLLCRLNLHRKLEVIQSFGTAQHIGCPDCGREYGIHHGERVVIPWTPELAELYECMGYDTALPSQRWRRYQRNMQAQP